MDLNMLNFCKKIAFTALVGCLTATTAYAGCVEDAKKYELDENLYNACLKEAKASDNNPELHYLFALWHLSGIQTPYFTKPVDMMSYRHFMFLSAEAGNMDAKATYVITEYSIEKAEHKELHPKVIQYLDDLAADKSDEGVLRYLKVKNSIVGLTEIADQEMLRSLANKTGNVDAVIEYAVLKMPKSVSSDISNFETSLKYFNKALADKKLPDNYRAWINWMIYEFYNRNENVEIKIKGEPYLKTLAYMGDINAQMKYAKAFATSKYGVLDEALSYAWNSLAKECATKAPEGMYNFALNDDLLSKISKDDIKKAEKIAKELRKDVKCLIVEKERYPAPATSAAEEK